jgi:membrane protease YdiL (CAAX protease family)
MTRPPKPTGPKAAAKPSQLTWLGWAALTGYFPLLLWLSADTPPTRSGLAPLTLRLGLFHGLGALWSLLLLRREGRLGAFAELAAHPWRGMGQGLLAFLALAGVITLLLRLPAGTLPSWLPALLHPHDLSPLPADPRLPMQLSGIWHLALVVSGGALEEWIFRCALWLRWAGGLPARPGPSSRANPVPLVHWAKLAAVSLYFAMLHWPQGQAAMIEAFSGSLVLGGLLYWRRSFWLIATLHALYNWNSLTPLK